MLSPIKRKMIIENFQGSLRSIRLLMNYSVSELAEIIDLPRQAVNELEAGRVAMNALQYISIAAFVDNFLRQKPEFFIEMQEIIDGNGRANFIGYDTSFSSDSLLELWFEDFISLSDEFEIDLRILADKFKVFLDADTLATEDAPEIVGDLIDAFEETDNKIIIPLRSIEKVMQDTDSEEAAQALRYIRRLQEMDFLQIQGEDSDPDFRETILNVFAKFRSTYRLCLITEDENVAQDVLKLNDDENGGFEIITGVIEDGSFIPYNFESEENPIDEEFFESEAAEKPDLSQNEIIGWEEL